MAHKLWYGTNYPYTWLMGSTNQNPKRVVSLASWCPCHQLCTNNTQQDLIIYCRHHSQASTHYHSSSFLHAIMKHYKIYAVCVKLRPQQQRKFSFTTLAPFQRYGSFCSGVFFIAAHCSHLHHVFQAIDCTGTDSGPEVLFETCVARKFVDDDDNDVDNQTCNNRQKIHQHQPYDTQVP